MFLEVHLECFGLAMPYLDRANSSLVCLLQSNRTVTNVLAYNDISKKAKVNLCAH